METLFYFLGFFIGISIGKNYIPHQIKKKNPKVIEEITKLLEENK